MMSQLIEDVKKYSWPIVDDSLAILDRILIVRWNQQPKYTIESLIIGITYI